MNIIKESSELDITPIAVPSLFQLSVAVISNFKLWSSAEDVLEKAVPLFLKGIKNTDFNLDHLPNLLPASLQYLDLTGFNSLNEEGIVSIVKKCFHLHTLILNDMPLLNDSAMYRILQNLPNLIHLSMGAGVDTLAMIEIQQPPNMLTHLEIHSAGLDNMWLEHLRYFPHLTTLKLRNAMVPRLPITDIKLPPNLSFVDITTLGQARDNNINLLIFFLTEAPNLVHLTLGGQQNLITKEIGPIVANKLRVLRGKGTMIVSQTVVDAISDTCHQLEEVSGFSLYVSEKDSKPIGVASVSAGQSPVSFTYTNKKWNHDFSGIKSRTAWKKSPTEFKAPFNSNYIFPMDPYPSLRKLQLEGGTFDVIGMLQLFPNLEELRLCSVDLKLEKLPDFATKALGSKLKKLHLYSNDVPSGAIDWLSKSTSLKRVHLDIDSIPEFKSQPIFLDTVLRRFPFIERLTILQRSPEIVIMNERNIGNIKAAVNDHPIKEIHFKGTVSKINNLRTYMKLEKLDFNHYKHLQLLSFHNVGINEGVTLHNRLRVLSAYNLEELKSTSFNFPETLYCLQWQTDYLRDRLAEAIPKMKNLCSVNVSSLSKSQVAEVLKNPAGYQPYYKLKYLIPPQQKTQKTNYLSAFMGIKDEALLVSTLETMLGSSGSNLSIEELQLIAQMYSKHEITLHSEEPRVNVKIRLASGTVLNIICNPSHRVLDLYAYARNAVKLGYKAFDLMTPFKKVLDVSTYGKTIQELDLAYVTLIQTLRDYTPVERELRNFGIAHIKLMEVGKNKNAGLMNSEGYSIQSASVVTFNNNNNNDMQNDEVSTSDNDSDDEESSECSEDNDSEEDYEYYAAQVSDDEEDWMSMFPEPEKEVDSRKDFIDQMNAAMIRKSIEYHEQKEREEEIRRFQAEQKRIAEEQSNREEEEVAAMFYSETSMRNLKMLRWQQHRDLALNCLLPTAQDNTPPASNNNYSKPLSVIQSIQSPSQNQKDAPPTDEELALMLQQEEFLQEDEFEHSYI